VTKRELTELAVVLKNSYPAAPGPDHQEEKTVYEGRVRQWCLMVRWIAQFCDQHSPRFDYNLFLMNCTYCE